MRPDGPARFLERIFARVERRGAFAVAVQDLGRDRRVGSVEMIGGFHADVALGRKVDADGAEDLRAERLGAVRDQRDLDAADANACAVAELHSGGPEALLAVLDETQDGRVAIDGQARGGRSLAADAQRDALADASRMTERDRDWV